MSLLEKNRFGVIVADPPWSFNDKLKYGGAIKRSADSHYPTLTPGIIRSLPVEQLAAENCILALWVPSAMLKVGLDAMEEWGFQYKQLWVWGKVSKKDPARLAFGMGRLGRNCHEPCLLGVKGKYTKFLENNSQRNLMMHPNIGHSSKPEQLQDSLDLMFPKWKKLELFARRKRPGWHCIGNESPTTKGEDIRDTLARMISGEGKKVAVL